jgi:hypothetical protein
VWKRWLAPPLDKLLTAMARKLDDATGRYGLPMTKRGFHPAWEIEGGPAPTCSSSSPIGAETVPSSESPAPTRFSLVSCPRPPCSS